MNKFNINELCVQGKTIDEIAEEFKKYIEREVYFRILEEIIDQKVKENYKLEPLESNLVLDRKDFWKLSSIDFEPNKVAIFKNDL